METAPRSGVEEDSIAALGRQFVEDASRLVRLEIELARAQAIESMLRFRTIAIVILLALGMVAMGFLYAVGSFAAYIGPKWLGGAWAGWAVWGGFIVLVGMAAAGLAVRSIMRTVRETRSTIERLKEDVEWVRQLARHDGRSS